MRDVVSLHREVFSPYLRGLLTALRARTSRGIGSLRDSAQLPLYDAVLERTHPDDLESLFAAGVDAVSEVYEAALRSAEWTGHPLVLDAGASAAIRALDGSLTPSPALVGAACDLLARHRDGSVYGVSTEAADDNAAPSQVVTLQSCCCPHRRCQLIVISVCTAVAVSWRTGLALLFAHPLP